MPAPGQHVHIPITFSFTTGPESVRLLVIAGALLVIAAAFVRPFVAMGRAAQLTITTVAGSAVLLLLLVAESLDMPQQAVVVLLGAAALPLVVAGQHGGAAQLLRPAAPWVAGAAGTFAAVELLRVLLVADDRTAAMRLVHTSIGIGLVGLSWLVLCRPDRRPVTNVGGWILGNVVLAGVAAVAVLGLS